MSNSDNVMARFLFAILQQKCLKDIDWNKVAHNPILAQEITNGHAARMRYSRFRAGLLGLQPQRRNRGDATTSKSRVSKKKKDDDVKPKKEEDEQDKKSSGSGIGNIKSEKIKTEGNTTPTIKSERRSIVELSPGPSQPPVLMATPVTAKAEPGPFNTFSQQPLHHPSGPSTCSPVIKQEKLAGPSSANTTTPPMPEPSPFGIVSSTPVTESAASTPYIDAHHIDAHHHMQLRLLTPCSDSDGISGMQGCFLPHSPGPSASEMLQSQQPIHHHSHAVGAGSPALSIATSAAPSPYDFSQCVVDPPVCPSPTPWYSQPHHSQHHHIVAHAHQHPQLHQHQHHNSQTSPVLFYSTGFRAPAGTGEGSGYFLNGNGSTSNGYMSSLFCDHQQHHSACHEENGQHPAHPHHVVVADPLGLHHHHHTASAAASSMFRERELELEMSRRAMAGNGGGGSGDGGAQGAKGEWEVGEGELDRI